MSAKIDLAEIPLEVRKAMGLPRATRAKAARRMAADEMRSHALRVMAAVAQLSQRDRDRVLRHALKVNAV